MTDRPFFVNCDAIGTAPVELFKPSLEKQRSRLILSSDLDLKDNVSNILDEWAHRLPSASEALGISANLEDYILVPTISMPSDLPNRNGQAFPFLELTGWCIDAGMQMYKTWIGQPTHMEHCFPAITPIRTRSGTKAIKNVQLGDKVLTHTKQFKKVIKKYKNGKKWLSEIVCQGLPEPIYVTENHPFWVVDRRQMYDTVRADRSGFQALGYNGNRKWDDFKPHWRPTSDCYVSDYLVAPIEIGGNISMPKEFAFLTGLHMAEGSYEWYKGKPVAVMLTLGRKEKELREKAIECCEALELTYSLNWHRKNNTCMIRVANKEFALRMLELTGKYAHTKRMKGDLRNWDKKSLSWFIGGYVSGDGCTKSGNIRCRTSSINLATDVWHTFCHLGVRAFTNKDGQPYRYSYECPRYNVTRQMNAKASWVIKADDFTGKLNKYMVAKASRLTEEDSDKKTFCRIVLFDGYMLMPIVSIRHKVRAENTYNLEVEEDNSYVAYNIVAHNCNKDPTKAKGIIFDCMMQPMANTNGSIFKVVKLLGFDRSRDPVLANDILSRRRTSYSMGAHARDFSCSICGTLRTQGGCEHVHGEGRPIMRVFNGRLGYNNITDPKGFECSSVISPAYHSAKDMPFFAWK